MPRYFFHLAFGDQIVLDEEGVELPNRSAAREEATAVIRELSKPELGATLRRLANCFLQVADGGGEFLRVPIGHSALKLVTQEVQPEEPEAEQSWPLRQQQKQSWRDDDREK